MAVEPGAIDAGIPVVVRLFAVATLIAIPVAATPPVLETVKVVFPEQKTAAEIFEAVPDVSVEDVEPKTRRAGRVPIPTS